MSDGCRANPCPCDCHRRRRKTETSEEFNAGYEAAMRDVVAWLSMELKGWPWPLSVSWIIRNLKSGETRGAAK